ncbi:MAG: hypothetical protein BLITH_0100 [Brockia lithotrophica]|uniref:TRAM domain-containing protein n=1 Tax=Brockia lithotrophica TaxID=933949 RepID=A0A2T5G509_9BACL|nr:TRAM domain-containing protein [Brockia lithotrophica]PTQ51274.1 MAG: hypothetical protein BLITH_0100 [Brockia lithotrophica]
MLLRRAFQVFMSLLGGALGYYVTTFLQFWEPVVSAYAPFVGAGIGGLLFLGLSFLLASPFERGVFRLEEALTRIPAGDLLSGIAGLFVGLLVSLLLYWPLKEVPVLNLFVPIFLSVFLGYLGFKVGASKKEELLAFFQVGRGRERGREREKEREDRAALAERSKANIKILDTSVIIDGRIADILDTGFLEGVLVVPLFVLEELQHIADSADVLKRNRGRRGLDILARMQKARKAPLLIYEGEAGEGPVDMRLVKLAKKLGAAILTTDFNLNKVCELQGIPVLNVNDLANALKPIVLPGEELTVHIIRDGKEEGQGVAYLEDGTMIVVEDGKAHMGERVAVVVTSVLQTSAGRMVFAKPKLYEKAL